MFGHPLELAIVFIIGLIVFGPKKLPEITRNVGRGINAFRKGLDGFNMQGENTDELAAIARRRELAELELQIIEKKAEAARQELQLRQMEIANAIDNGSTTTIETVETDSSSDQDGIDAGASELIASEQEEEGSEVGEAETTHIGAALEESGNGDVAATSPSISSLPEVATAEAKSQQSK